MWFTSQAGARRRVARWAILPALIAAMAAFALPSSASAASCPVTPGLFATAWNGGDGNLGSENWTNGTPTGSCDVTIASPGSDVITMTGGANMRSLTLGGTDSTPQLVISDQSPNTNLDAQPAGITIAAGASVTLTCQPGGCPNGGPDIYSGSSPFTNAGTITVGANTGGGAVVGGQITNTGTIAFQQTGSLSGKVTNQGLISVADGATVTNSGSSCGDTGALVKNDTGGLIEGGATGVLSVRNFEQGAGTTKDVTSPCGGTLNYTGGGPSEIRATGGFNLTGEMQAGQALTISAEGNNTNAALQSNFVNNGSITLTCPAFGCNGGATGGAGFNVNDKDFVNAGTFTVSVSSGTGAGLGANNEGTILNTGTLQFDQSGYLSGVVTNKGTIEVADGKTAISPTGHCGDSTPRVINDAGGNVSSTGSGTLRAVNFEQGAGTTTGTAPVTVDCGALKYIGTGISTIRVNTSATMTGNIAAGQTLRIAGQVNGGAFINAGTIVLDQSGSNPTLNTGTVTNTGKIETAGPSGNTSQVNGQIDQTGIAARVVVTPSTKLQLGNVLLLKAGSLSGGGTLGGSVENSGGTVKPGESPGTLTLTGNYTQGVNGLLELELGGTAPGEFDVLYVGGSANIADSVLDLVLINGYEDIAAIGDNFPLIYYGGSLTGTFTMVRLSPSLPCPQTLLFNYGSGLNAFQATIGNSGTICGGDGGDGGGTSGGGSTVTQPPPVLVAPATPPAKKTCPKGKQLKKGKCVAKCPKGKKLKKGRCVKRKQPKARSRQR